MTEKEQRKAAKDFAERWKERGYEKGDSQTFWLSLLREVYGVEYPSEYIKFEEKVIIDKTSFIDAVIDDTRVLIEQKSRGKDLNKPIMQSDGTLLTPFQQAKRYIADLPVSKHPLWVVTSNFDEFLVYDMNQPQGAPEQIFLKDFEKEFYRLSFLVKENNLHIEKEQKVSVKAGELVGVLYDALLKEYLNPEDEETLKHLNILCVRIVFCLYAEDAGIFGRKGMFYDYLKKYEKHTFRDALKNLFIVLDQKEEERDKYLENDLAAFPYVNGGLFENKDVQIPRMNEEIIDIILNKASANFDWSEISPTIFGAVFESTLNPESRRSGGMHYTSIKNIHKVIDPLFLNELREEFEQIMSLRIITTRDKRLKLFQQKLASLTFLDPAAGSGNFLTETYLSLRRLENKILFELQKNQMGFGTIINPIKVSIKQFYGIELNDFAVSVARAALWIAESQMMTETEEILVADIDFLPLTSNEQIIEGNALRLDWHSIVPNWKLTYIMGNPPFIGSSITDGNNSQKEDMSLLFQSVKGAGKLDYVAGWYLKSAQYIRRTKIQCAFVSTNSITQGEQVALLWKELFENYNIEITFAHRSFKWESESQKSAAVVCVIIGFSEKNIAKDKFIFDGPVVKKVDYINGYLNDQRDIYIKSRRESITKNVPQIIQGNKPWDEGYLILKEEQKKHLEKKYPQSKNYIKEYIGGHELINNKKRYCLWLLHVEPSEYVNIPEIRERLVNVANIRQKTKTKAVQEQAKTPMLFSQIRQPLTGYLAIPEVSTDSRAYIPMAFLSKDVISSNKLFMLPDASLYVFGVITSVVHMGWMRTVAGRLGTAYSYSPSVYNNFPWASPTIKERQCIEETAQNILNARNIYSNSSLADLYDKKSMPPELREAHEKNDIAVMNAYGFDIKMSESEFVSELMKMYQKQTRQIAVQ